MARKDLTPSLAKSRNFKPVITPLAAAVMLALYPMGPAQAQDDADQSANEVIDEVVTTGSRIRRDTFSSAAPMDVVITETAAVRGITDVASLLQATSIAAGSPQVTAAYSAAASVTDGFSPSNGGVGTATLSLRGLGANRTLVLLNGRRAGPSGVQGSVSSFDLNTIPLAAIEHIEVLKDGASSIYGSDAVAGVVNIITRKDDGGTLDAYVSQPDDSGGEHTRLSASWGKKFDRGYFRVTADYSKSEILARKDRDFLDCEEDYYFDLDTGERADLIDPRTGEFLCNDLPWGHVWVYDYAAGVGDGTENAGGPPYLLQFDHDGSLAANGVQPLAPATSPNHMTTPAGWFPIRQGDGLSDAIYDSQHPFHAGTTLVPDSEVTTLFLEGEYDVSDNVSAYTEVLLNRRETEALGYRQVWTYIYNYDSADLGYYSDPFSAGWTGANWLSPLTISERNDSKVTVDYQRIVLGLRGENESFMAGWDWDVSFQYSNSDGKYVSDQVRKDALEGQFFRTGSCVGQVTPISNLPCIDIQWLDPDFLAGDIPQEVEDYLWGVDVGNTEYKQWSVEGFMTGDIFEMPAGAAAMAFGFHYRDDEILDTPGEIVLAGNAWESEAAGITKGDTQTTAVFVEFDLPLLAGKPMVEYLDFNVSARYTEVEVSGFSKAYDDTTYKVGLNWAITDSFRARTSFGTSFRSPALFELFLANQTSFLAPRIADPCDAWGNNLALGNIGQRVADNCAAEGIPADHTSTVGPAVLTGGGADVLTAETSESFTIGFVWQPAFTELNVSIDYFDILVEDTVDKIGGVNIVFGCYESIFFPNEPLCDQFDRSPPTAGLSNSIEEIRDSFINVAKQQIKGVDIAATWTTDIGDTSNLTIDTQWTINFEDILALFDETEEDLAGLAGHPETVGNVGVTLNMSAWSVYWGVNYIDETDNTERFGQDSIQDSEGTQRAFDLVAESVVYHTVSVSYAFGNGLLVRAGMANLTDEAPPRLTKTQTSSEVDVIGKAAFYSQYDWFGRRAFLNLTMDF